jgi:hypothetical protein
MVFLCCPAPALGSTGSITLASVNSRWTMARVAGSVQWDGCQRNHQCYWRPYLSFQPDTPEYACNGGEAFEVGIDSNLRSSWPVAAQVANGAVEFDLAGIETLAGLPGQRVCLSVVYFRWKPADWCSEVVYGPTPTCVWESSVAGVNLASAVLMAEPSSPPEMPAALPASPAAAAAAPPKRCSKRQRLVRRHGKTACVKRHPGRGWKGKR